MLSKKGFEKAVLEAHSLLQISPKNHDDVWDCDRKQWLKNWQHLLLKNKKGSSENEMV